MQPLHPPSPEKSRARYLWSVSVAVCLLQGCAGIPSSGQPELAPAATGPVACEASAAQFALGRSFGPELEREVRTKSGARLVRWLSPGQVVTMEFNAMRLSLTLDGRGRVVRAACG